MAILSLQRGRVGPSGVVVPGPGAFRVPAAVALALAAAPGLRPMGAPGEPAWSRVAGPVTNAPAPIGDAAWSLLLLRGTGATVAGLDGAPLRLPSGAALGAGAGPVLHWLDAALASACVVAARLALNAAVAARDPAGLAQCLRWIAAAYNCLNVPWQCDPRARMLWRRHLSGPAADLGSEYAGGGVSGADWNACTTVRNNLDPRVYVCADPAGAIPAAGRAVFERCLPAGPDVARRIVGQFIPFYWIGQDLVPGAPPIADAGRAPPAGSGGDDEGVMPTRATDRVQAVAPALQNYADFRGAGFGEGRDAACAPNGHASDPVNTWDGYAFDSGWSSPAPPPLRYAAAVADYAPWLSAWLDALEARSAGGVVYESRLYCAYLNLRTANGTDLARVAAAQGADIAAEFASNPQAQADLQMVRAGAGALAGVVAALAVAGGAAAGVTAGVSAIVLGSVAAITAVAGALWPPDSSSWKLDDLLRVRPWVERAWLAGSPGDQSDAGAPVEVMVLAPAGWSRPAEPAAAGGAPPGVTPALPGTAAHAAGVVVGGGAAAAGVWALVSHLSSAAGLAGSVRGAVARRR